MDLHQLIQGHWIFQATYSAVKLDIFEHLAIQELDITALSERTGITPAPLARLLQVLISLELIQEDSAQKLQLTPQGQRFSQQHPQSLRSTMLLMGHPLRYQAWGNLLHSLQTGQSAFENNAGMSVFEHLVSEPELTQHYQQTMANFSRQEAEAILQVYDFSDFQQLADIGGGYGAFLQVLLAHYPHPQGLLFDSQTVIAQAQQNKHPRIRYVSGSFFSAVPPHCDAYILKNILHNWNDAKALQILQTCHRDMPQQARLLIIEDILDQRKPDLSTALLDLNMLVMYSGGQERSREQYQQLLNQAGFCLSQSITTRDAICLLECEKIRD